MATRPDIRQSISRDFLDQVLATDPGATGKQVDAVLRSFNNEVTPPLRMKQTTVANRVLNIGAITVTNPDTSRVRTVVPIHGLLPTFTSGTVTLDATGAGNATPSVGSLIALAMTASQFMKIGVSLNSSGQLVLSKGTAAGSLAAAGAPAALSDNHAVGYFVARTDGSNNVQNVLDSDIYQYPVSRAANVDSALPMVGSAANANLNSTLITIDADLAKLFEDRNVMLTDGGIITYTGTQTQFTQALKLHINSQIAGGAPTVIDLGATTRNFSADGRMLYAVIDRIGGTATVTADSATLPSVVAANIEVFLIAKRKDSPDGVSRVYFRNGSALDIGQSARLGSSGSGSGSGNPILESLKNELVDSPYEMFTPNIITTDTNTKIATVTGAAYDLVNKVVNFSANSQNMVSTQNLDTAEFLSRNLDVGSVDLSVFWNKGTTLQAFAVPDAATTYSSLSVSTLSGSAVVTVNAGVAHHLTALSRITITTATAIGGISSGNLSQSNVLVTVLSETTFSYTAGGSASSSTTGTLDTLAVLGFTYEVSRDGTNNWFTVPMVRVGTTEVFRGPLQFDRTSTTESTNQTFKSQAAQTSSTVVTDVAGGVVAIGQGFTLTNTARVKKVTLNLAKGSGTPVGNIFISFIKDVSGFPSTNPADVVSQSSAILISGIGLTTSQANYTFDVPSTMLVSGTVYHVVMTTDATFKAGYTSSVNNSIKIGYNNSGASSPFLDLFNGSSVWTTPGSFNLTYALLGRELDLRVRISSPTTGTFTYPTGLDGYGLFYSLQDVGIVGSVKKTARRGFNSVTDNTSTFTLSEFTPDPDLLEVFYVEVGQVFKSPAFTVYGNQIVFPTNTFNNGGVSAAVTLIFDQNNGGAFDNSDSNRRVIAANHLGSTNAADDASAAGRGIILRSGAGTLIEQAIDTDGLPIYLSVP